MLAHLSYAYNPQKMMKQVYGINCYQSVAVYIAGIRVCTLTAMDLLGQQTFPAGTKCIHQRWLPLQPKKTTQRDKANNFQIQNRKSRNPLSSWTARKANNESAPDQLGAV